MTMVSWVGDHHDDHEGEDHDDHEGEDHDDHGRRSRRSRGRRSRRSWSDITTIMEMSITTIRDEHGDHHMEAEGINISDASIADVRYYLVLIRQQ